MPTLTITDLNGTHEVSALDDLAQTLAELLSADNHLMVTRYAAGYPMLDVVARDQLAVLHFFSAEAGPVAQSLAESPAGLGGEIVFPAHLTGEPMVLPALSVVPLDVALQCVEEFARSGQRPRRIGWLEL